MFWKIYIFLILDFLTQSQLETISPHWFDQRDTSGKGGKQMMYVLRED